MSETPVCPGQCSSRVAVLESQMAVVSSAMSDINDKLDKILEQTTRHNGRLTRLEDDVRRNFDHDEKRDAEINGIKLKLAWAMGACGVIGAVISVVIQFALK